MASSKSSGSEGAAVDERKRKRMESNRESARRSRQRKQQHLDDLVRQAAELQRQNSEFAGKTAEMARILGAVDAANAVLRAEKERLARRLELLESLLEIYKVVKAGSQGVVGSFLESSNGGLMGELGGGFLDGDGGWDFGVVKPWQQMVAGPAASISMPVMAASSGGMCQF